MLPCWLLLNFSITWSADLKWSSPDLSSFGTYLKWSLVKSKQIVCAVSKRLTSFPKCGRWNQIIHSSRGPARSIFAFVTCPCTEEKDLSSSQQTLSTCELCECSCSVFYFASFKIQLLTGGKCIGTWHSLSTESLQCILRIRWGSGPADSGRRTTLFGSVICWQGPTNACHP